MVRNIMRLDLAVISISKHLKQVEKFPTCVVVNSANQGFHCSRDFWCEFL